MTLEDEFEQECWRAVEAGREFRYTPTAWIAMIRRSGAAAAARQLLLSGEIQSGFDRLVREGRLDLTVEFAVLNPRWDSLFGPDVREAAWWRLAKVVNSRF